MGLFGNKQPEGKTLLLLDVENGSVGSALVHLQPDQPLKLFGERRANLRVLPTRDSQSLLREIQHGIHTAASHIAELAASLRQHDTTNQAGSISRAAIYLGAPWSQPDLAQGTPSFVGRMRDIVRRELELLGPMQHSFFTATGGVLGGASRALPNDDTYLLCIVGGEVTELLLVHNNNASGYATLPLGTHTLVRTMRAHGFSDAEAHSAMRLPPDHAEPMLAAQKQFAHEFEATVGTLLHHSPIKRVWVVSRGELGEWFAKALSNSANVAGLFPQGGEVRVLRASHVAPHLTAHAHEPDLLLGLHALHAEAVPTGRQVL